MDAPMDQKVANPYYTYGILYLSENFKRWEASQGPAYRDYRRAWVDRPAAQDPGKFPLNLNVEVTTRCNLACTFCTQPTLTKEQLGDMPWDLFARVIEEGQRYQTPAANLNGLGEPTLVRNLSRMIAHAKQHGFLDVMFHTNGTLLNESIGRSLIESGLDRIIFSVDAPDKKTYEAMRIRARWEEVVERVRRFWELRHRMGSSAPLIRTTMVMTDKTVHQVPDLVNLWKPIADQITLQDLTWRSKLLDRGVWQNQEGSAIPTNLDEVREEAIRKKISFVCPYLYQSADVYWNGDVIPCCNPNARKHMVMGTLKEQSLQEVWLGQKYDEIRTLHATGRWHEHPICRTCEVPLIELYKKMNAEKEEPSSVASEMAPKDGSGSDLVIRYHKESTR